jgi:3-oxoacyl-[acyl-carrier-protein] synthase II
VTGAGLVTALGADTRSTWTRLERGESAVAPLRRFDPPPGAARSGAEAGSLDPPPGLRVPKHAKFMGRATRCAVVAATEAIAQASLASAGVDPDRFAIMTGTGDTGLDVEEFFPSLTAAWAGEETLDYAAWGGRASRLVDPYFSLRTLSNAAAALLAIELGARGASSNFVQGACAGAHALAAACDELHERRSDVVLVTGSDALVDLSSWLAYSRVNRLSRLPPDRACRPFDVEADGLALGEAGAALVLERAADARARGARVLGEVAGVGLACARGDAGRRRCRRRSRPSGVRHRPRWRDAGRGSP